MQLFSFCITFKNDQNLTEAFQVCSWAHASAGFAPWFCLEAAFRKGRSYLSRPLEASFGVKPLGGTMAFSRLSAIRIIRVLLRERMPHEQHSSAPRTTRSRAAPEPPQGTAVGTGLERELGCELRFRSRLREFRKTHSASSQRGKEGCEPLLSKPFIRRRGLLP